MIETLLVASLFGLISGAVGVGLYIKLHSECKESEASFKETPPPKLFVNKQRPLTENEKYLLALRNEIK